MAFEDNFLCVEMSGGWSVCEQKRGERGLEGQEETRLQSVIIRSSDFIPEPSKDFKKQGRINK